MEIEELIESLRYKSELIKKDYVFGKRAMKELAEEIDIVLKELIIKNKMVEYMLNDIENKYQKDKKLYNEYYKLGEYYFLKYVNKE